MHPLSPCIRTVNGQCSHHDNDLVDQIGVVAKTCCVCFSLGVIPSCAHLSSWANLNRSLNGLASLICTRTYSDKSSTLMSPRRPPQCYRSSSGYGSRYRIGTMFGQVGSLGLPGTKWNREGVLDAQLQSQGLSTLLLELVQRGELHIEPHLCVVMIGLGCGANALLHFAATKPVDPVLRVLLDSTRFLVAINPLPLAPTSSSEAQQVKRSIQTLKRVLQRGKHHEQLQALTTAFFSDDFISQVSSGCHLHLRR